MSLSISRDLDDLTPEQPTFEENIAKANKILEKEGERLNRDTVPMWFVNLLKYIFQKQEGKLMDKLVAQSLEEVQKTKLDDKLYKIIADILKEEIPGTHYEPIIGEAMQGIGEELKKPE